MCLEVQINMRRKHLINVSIGLLMCATALMAIDVFILGFVTVKTAVSSFDKFWTVINDYLFFSRYRIVHLSVIGLFIAGFVFLHYGLGKK